MEKSKNVQSVKISKELYGKIRELAKKEERFINYHFNKALQNYLISKKAM